MATIIHETSPKAKFAFTTSNSINSDESYQNYLTARNEADALVEKHKLRNVATLPQTILLQDDPEFNAILDKTWVDTTSAEFQGTFKGHKYIVAHGFGPLATAKGVDNNWLQKSKNYSFVPIDKDSWRELVKTDSVQVLTYDDILQEKDIDLSQPYIIIAQVNDSKFNYNKSGELSLNDFENDSIVHMRAGSIKNAEKLSNFFKNTKNRLTAYNVHRFNEVGFKKCVGRPLFCWDNGVYGLDDDIDSVGVFVGVGDGVASVGDATAQKTNYSTVVKPTLEQTIDVLNDPDLNREGMIKKVTELYNK
ncbi:MAG: hypothetical protein ABH828_03945 [archaeon]